MSATLSPTTPVQSGRAAVLVGGLLAAFVAGACTMPNRDFQRRADAAAFPDAGADVGGTGGAGGGNAAGGTGGNAGSPDAPGDSAADTPDAVTGAPPCGQKQPNLSVVRNADGLAISKGGVIYYSWSGGAHAYIGRLMPNDEHVAMWKRIDDEASPQGLAYDSERQRLYVVGALTKAIYLFDLAGPTPNVPQRWATGAIERPSEVVVAPDGTVYLTDEPSGAVWRQSLAGATLEKVSSAPLGTPADGRTPASLAFGPEGHLFVGIHHQGRIHKLLLKDGLEAGPRDVFGTWELWGNALAFDTQGRLFISAYAYDKTGHVYVAARDGAGVLTPVTAPGAYASIAFGRGELRCNDLYIAVPEGAMIRYESSADGLPLP